MGIQLHTGLFGLAHMPVLLATYGGSWRKGKAGGTAPSPQAGGLTALLHHPHTLFHGYTEEP